MSALKQLAEWQVPHAAAAVIRPDGIAAQWGDADRPFPIASVTKLLTGYAIMLAVQEEAVGLEDPAGPPGATLRHLLAHTAGYGFDVGSPPMAEPGARRIYSNEGMERAAAHVAAASGLPFGEYLRQAVLTPLRLDATSVGGDRGADTPFSAGMVSTVGDLARFALEIFAGRLLTRELLMEMITVQFPGVSGVMPGVGRFDPLDWGLAFERTFGRPGHWAGPALSRSAFGHFGGAGTFWWLDPTADLALVCLTDREFGPWALEAWPALADAVLSEYRAGLTG